MTAKWLTINTSHQSARAPPLLHPVQETESNLDHLLTVSRFPSAVAVVAARNRNNSPESAERSIPQRLTPAGKLNRHGFDRRVLPASPPCDAR